jgi:rhodanese-related sulfurtransferase
MLAQLMGLRTVSPDALHDLMQGRGDVAIFDLNSRQSWESARVPGARHLDAKRYGDDELPSDRNAMLVFYCSNPMCRKAPNAARRARQGGYANVYVMSAGIGGWLAARLPTESGPCS